MSGVSNPQNVFLCVCVRICRNELVLKKMNRLSGTSVWWNETRIDGAIGRDAYERVCIVHGITVRYSKDRLNFTLCACLSGPEPANFSMIHEV
jgi:hypothetical protein